VRKIHKIISLGESCATFIELRAYMPKERYPFDAARVTHDALNNILKSKFVHILNPDKNLPYDNVIRIAFYEPYDGFMFGHQNKKDILEIDQKIKRRSQRFLDLKDYNHKILFIRERFFYGDHQDTKDNIIYKIENEYFEIFNNLKQLGFKDFEFLYIVNFPLSTLDGELTIEEGLYNNILFADKMNDTLEERLDKWNYIRNIINENFDLSCLTEKTENPEDIQGFFIDSFN